MLKVTEVRRTVTRAKVRADVPCLLCTWCGIRSLQLLQLLQQQLCRSCCTDKETEAKESQAAAGTGLKPGMGHDLCASVWLGLEALGTVLPWGRLFVWPRAPTPQTRSPHRDPLDLP